VTCGSTWIRIILKRLKQLRLNTTMYTAAYPLCIHGGTSLLAVIDHVLNPTLTTVWYSFIRSPIAQLIRASRPEGRLNVIGRGYYSCRARHRACACI
jgi:hypothetical protein